MNLFKLSLSYLQKKALNTLLNVLLLSFGIAVIIILLLFTHQIEDNLYKNAEGIDVVVGAKGSPIQLILSSIYHIDAPTGNITLGEAKELMNNRLVNHSIPLALGDNYRGYRIVGTTTEYLVKYSATLAEGNLWEFEFEVLLGSDVAAFEGLNIGDEIFSVHGFSSAGHTHDDHSLTVTGILQPTGTVIDRLILTGVETMWGIHQVHSHDDHDSQEHGNEHENTHNHDHISRHSHDHDQIDADHTSAGNNLHNHDLNGSDGFNPHTHNVPLEHKHGQNHPNIRRIFDDSYLNSEYKDEQITSLLIRYGNPLAAAQFPRYVNEQTSMQAASPALEITRLLGLLGVGIDAIRMFSFILILSAVLGIFIALLNSMKERKYDLAIMRTLGSSRLKLFLHITLEGTIVAVAGGLLGIILGHLAVEGIGMMFSEARQFAVTGFVFIIEELYVFVLILTIGIISSAIPATMAYKTDIAKTLSQV